MNEPLKLVTKEPSSVDDTLHQAAESGFDEIMLIGWRNGFYTVLNSRISSRREVLGDLALIQYEALKGD